MRAFLATLVVLALAATPALGQMNTGEIAGLVKDASGAVVPGATVSAKHPASGSLVERTSDDEGRFYLPSLRTGSWDVTAALPGFAPHTVQGVALDIGATLNMVFTLKVGSLSEQLIVSARTPLIQTTTAEISDVIQNREVVQIPLNGRTFLSLAQLSDGVVLPPGGTRGDALQQAGPLPNVGGQRSGHNIYLLDGVKVTDELFNNLVISPSVDSINEFKIQKSMYAAEFGGKASALINVATRAGGNARRGSVFEFFRNDRFDAHNYFDVPGTPVPPLDQHQFGGTFGGPLIRDRTFFFASYERQQMDRSLTRTFSVPSNAVRSGDFSGQGTICDPVAAGGCVPFANNKIPIERIDPVASAFLQQVPRATSVGELQNLTSVELLERSINQVSLRLDHRLGAAGQIFVRVSTFDADETQPFGTSALQEALVPGFGRTLTTKTRNVAISHTHTFSPTVLNEFRVGWMHVTGGQASLNRGVDFASAVGLLGVTTDPRDVGYPQIATRGQYSTMGDPTSFVYRNNRHIDIYDSLTIDRGAHHLKVGGSFYRLQMRPEQPDNARGAFTYTGQFSGNAFADFLLGYPTSATSGIGRGDEDGRTTWLHLYAQDDWRVRDNLTINAGLRYEYNQHMYDSNNRLSSVDLAVPGGRFVIASDADGTISPDAADMLSLIPIPYVTSADADWGRGLLEPSRVRLAPRFGAVLGFNGDRGVVRGGYGVFLNQWAYSVQTAFARNLPFFFTKQVDVPVENKVPALQTKDILTSNATGTIGASIMDYDYAVEYSQSWSGGVQYELFPATMIEVSYLGTWTLGADNSTIRNVPDPGPGPIQPRRPIPQLSRINAIRFDGKSIYHGVTFRVDRRLRGDAAVSASYTLSSSIDDASSPGTTEAETNLPQDVNNIFSESGEWAHSSFDHRHVFVASGMYGLPFYRNAGGWREAVLADWRVNGVIMLQSGAPFTVNLGVDQANVGAGPAQRPNQSREANLPAGEQSADRWFDTSAFTLPDLYTFGSARRNSVLGPGYASVDMALAKRWTLGNAGLEFRWEVFNLLNRTNFDLPNRTFGTANFGRIFSAKNPREMQFGVRFDF